MVTTVVGNADHLLTRLNIDRAALEALCRANGVRRLALFGSVVRPDFDLQRSDLDVLVALDAPSCTTYADQYFSLMEGLERLTGRRVDLLTEQSITNRYLAQHISAEKVTLYAA